MDWTLLPGTNMPEALVQQLPQGGGSAPRAALTNAWVTGVLDSSRGKFLLVRTGGHGDGAHNGVRSLDLAARTWAFLRADSLAYTHRTGLPDDLTANYKPIYTDGTPASVHTYDGVCYMPPPFDEVWSAGGVYWSPHGGSGPTTFAFSLRTNTYRDIPDRTGGYSCISCWDPVASRVLFRTSGGFYAYTPVVGGPGTYQTLFTSSAVSGIDLTSSLALDPVARKVYYVIKGQLNVRMIDLNALTAKDQAITVTGDTAISTRAAPGLVFDAGRLVGYGLTADGLNGAVYVLDLTTMVWARQTVGGTAPPPPNTQGFWKKFFKWGDAYYAFYHSGTYSVTLGDVAIPTTKVIQVAADIAVNAVWEAEPPDPPTEPPPDGTNPIPANTWTMVPTLPAGIPHSVRAGKHARLTWDSNRLRFLLAGGDRFGSSGGQTAVEAFDPTTGLATVLSPSCPAAPLVMPNWPDNCGWCYDSTRDRALMFKGFYFTTRSSIRPAGTLTPAATTGTNVLFTASAAVFTSHHVGFPLKRMAGTTVVGEAIITSFVSTTQVRGNISATIPFPDTTAIPSGSWLISGFLAGGAAVTCDRNINEGDTNVVEVDVIYNCATNLWEHRTWATSPLGNGSDGNGPTNAVYDEATDSAYMMKGKIPGKLQILHCATNTWEVITPGTGMAAGAEKTLVINANSYRASIVIANGTIYFMSNRSAMQALISYTIASRVWHAYAVPGGYTPILDEGEPQLVYDPVSNVLMHPCATNLTSNLNMLYIFDIASGAWLTPLAIPVLTEIVNQGTAVWDPKTKSMMIWGRRAQSVPGYPCYHYRYAP